MSRPSTRAAGAGPRSTCPAGRRGDRMSAAAATRRLWPAHRARRRRPDAEALAGDLAAYTPSSSAFRPRPRPDLAAATAPASLGQSGGHLVTLYHRPADGWDPDHAAPLVIGAPARWRHQMAAPHRAGARRLPAPTASGPTTGPVGQGTRALFRRAVGRRLCAAARHEARGAARRQPLSAPVAAPHTTRASSSTTSSTAWCGAFGSWPISCSRQPSNRPASGDATSCVPSAAASSTHGRRS